MRLSVFFAVLATLVVLRPCSGIETQRTWTDSTGVYKTEAVLVKKNASSVTLRKADGKEITLPLSKLSAADLEYLNKAATPANVKPANAGRMLSAAEITKLQALAKANNCSVELEDEKLVAVNLGKIDPKVLAQFRDLPTVKIFSTYLSYSTLKNADLAVIGSMKNLEEINLDACAIDGLDGLKSIAALPELKRLSIGEGGVDDAEMAIIKNNQAIEDLDLYSHSLSNAGLKHIATMANLKKLSLRTSPEHRNTVTDDGVSHLSVLNKLELLELSGSAFTDKCMDAIGKLPALKSLKVGSTKISDAAKKKLKQAKPELKIF